MKDYLEIKKSYGRNVTGFSRSVSAAELGFHEPPNHKLGVSEAPTKYSGVYFECECGFRFSVQPRTDGSPTSATARKWSEHVEETSFSSATRIEMGTIQRQKKPLQTLFVALASFNDGMFVRSNTGRPAKTGWCVYSEADDGHAVIANRKTRSSAMTEAQRVLDVAQRRGSKVTRESTEVVIPSDETVRGVLSNLLVAQAENLDEIMKLIDALEEVLLVVPMLEHRKLELETQRGESIRSLLV